jgi:hypothetical protein
LINLFFDVETTHTQPVSGELISIGMYATDQDYNIIGEFYEECSLGGPRIITDIYNKPLNRWPDPVGGHDKSKWNATDVHQILWDKAQHFQTPVSLYRKLWTFLHDLPDEKFNFVYHNQARFDTNWLFYRSNIWAPPLYQYLTSKSYTFEYTELEGCVHSLRYDDTMTMARKYMRIGSDGQKQADKLQKIIDKNQAYLSKDRKTPAKPEQIKKWNDAMVNAQNSMVIMDTPDIQLEGYALNKICRSLKIHHDHHDARSDAYVLIEIHRFLSGHK